MKGLKEYGEKNKKEVKTEMVVKELTEMTMH